MKQWLSAYSRLSRMEKLGYAVLTSLIVLLLLLRCTMNLWVKPKGFDQAASAKYNSAWLAYKLHQDSIALAGEVPASAEVNGSLFAFDPNTLDSNGFIRLGMPAKAVKGLLNWRRKGKHFYKPEDLRPLYNLPAETYAKLEPYITIEHEDKTTFDHWADKYPPIPAIIDLNTADSTLLDRGINGIGATLARKIVQRRAALGGYYKHEQLMEIYRFPDTTFQRIKAKLVINPATVKRMNLNTVELAQMSSHPYVGEKTGKNILLYRDGIRRFERVEQLREVPLMNEEIYRKIAPYFTVE